MANEKFDLLKIRELHRKGLFDEAKKGYLALIKTNPCDAEALHSLGILLVQQENFKEAVDYLEKAIHYQPNDITYQLHLANVLKLQGLFNEAIKILENIVHTHPGYAPAFNNLGSVYFAEKKLDEAIRSYQKAIAIEPNYVDAYYNLGLVLTKKNLWQEASDIYQKILNRSPDHAAARFHLACLYMKEGEIPRAISEFLKVETLESHHFETQTNLATCYLHQGKLNEAKSHYLKALALRQDDSQILFNLGVICMQQGDVDYAIQYYQRLLQKEPNSFATLNNIGVAFLAKQHAGLALEHFQKALMIEPKNATLAYTVRVLAKNERLHKAPPHYIETLFDAYADHYDSHLLLALDYQIPNLLKQQVGKMLPNYPIDILDLGVGTGLCGVPFKSNAKTLIGVDLSKKMLEVCQAKQIYDGLVTSDFITYLKNTVEKFDLILAGDVLVYIGDLKETFQSVHQALREHGLFVFNTEMCDGIDYRMNQSGRFSHHKTYLDQLALTFHFKIISYRLAITRLQNNEPVKGHVYVLQRINVS